MDGAAPAQQPDQLVVVVGTGGVGGWGGVPERLAEGTEPIFFTLLHNQLNASETVKPQSDLFLLKLHSPVII